MMAASAAVSTCPGSSAASPSPGLSQLASPHLPPSSPALPSVLINIRTSVQSVVVGHAVEFECLALGDPKPQVTWSKVGGRLRPGIVQSGGIVRIARVELADAGQYRCTATNAAGTTQSHVLLLVQGEGRGGWACSAASCPPCPPPSSHSCGEFQLSVFRERVS